MKEVFLNAGMLAGVAIFLYGMFLLWHPLAFICGGVILTSVCAALVRSVGE